MSADAGAFPRAVSSAWLLGSSAPDLCIPVVGFRQWRISRGRLTSPYTGTTWASAELRASCGAGHHDPADTPASRCTCGIYTLYEPCRAWPPPRPLTLSAAPSSFGAASRLMPPGCGHLTRASSGSSYQSRGAASDGGSPRSPNGWVCRSCRTAHCGRPPRSTDSRCHLRCARPARSRHGLGRADSAGAAAAGLIGPV